MAWLSQWRAVSWMSIGGVLLGACRADEPPAGSQTPTTVGATDTHSSPTSPTATSPPTTNSPTTSPALPAGISELVFTQEIDGVVEERLVVLHAPADLVADRRYRVVFGFHGFGGTGHGLVGEWAELVDAGEVVGVYPNGHQASWNLGTEPSTADDVAFVEEIIDHLARYPQLELDRPMAMGFSNGAGMVHHLGIHSTHFTSLAAVSTALLADDLPAASSPPVSMLQIHGMEDETCPYAGGYSPQTGHTFLAAEESAAVWASHAGCSALPESSETTSGNHHIRYGGCAEARTVEHYGVVGAGHGIDVDFEGGLIPLIWQFLSHAP